MSSFFSFFFFFFFLFQAAMVDDVLSLVILAVLSELVGDSDEDDAVVDTGGSSNDAWTIVRPIVISVAAMFLGAVLVAFVPRTHLWLTQNWPDARRESATLVSLLALTFGLTVAAGYAGTTHLLGAFIGWLVGCLVGWLVGDLLRKNK